MSICASVRQIWKPQLRSLVYHRRLNCYCLDSISSYIASRIESIQKTYATASELGRNPVRKHQIQLEMSKLTRDGTAVPVSRYIIILGANAPDRGKYYFPYSADHVQDCSPYPAQLINIYYFYMCDLYIIHMYAYIVFATYVCMLVYCVYCLYIIEGFLASTFCGGNLTKNPSEVLWQTVCRGIYFLKHS